MNSLQHTSRNPLFEDDDNDFDGSYGVSQESYEYSRRQFDNYRTGHYDGHFAENLGVHNPGFIPDYETENYSKYGKSIGHERERAQEFEISDDGGKLSHNNYREERKRRQEKHNREILDEDDIVLFDSANFLDALPNHYDPHDKEHFSRNTDLVHYNYEDRNEYQRAHMMNNEQEAEDIQETYFRGGYHKRDNGAWKDNPDDGEQYEQQKDSGFNNNQTLIYRKKRSRNGLNDHQMDCENIPNRRSMNLSSLHREKRRTLKEKRERLIETRSTHDLAELYRNEILYKGETNQNGTGRQKQAWNRFNTQAKEVLYRFELWSSSFKTIEGQFGTAVMSYFRFIRWLLFLNLYISLVFVCLVLIPHLVLDKQTMTRATQSNSTDASSLTMFEHQADNCSREYIKSLSEHEQKEDDFSKVLDFLQGTGWMENTELFYGRYAYFYGYNDVKVYNMGLLYLVAVGATFIICFCLLVRNSGKGLKQRVLDRNNEITQFTNKVLTSWDYCICDSKAAKLKKINLKMELKADLENQRLQWRKENRTSTERFKILAIRAMINFLVICILGGSMYLIYYSNQQLIKLQKQIVNGPAVIQFLVQYLPSFTITILNVIVPVVFNKIVLLEDYSHVIEIRMTLLRTILLRLASLGVLMVSLYHQIQNNDGSTSNSTELLCGNKKWNTESNSNSSDSDGSIKCSETFVGQQFYKLVLVDFLAAVIIIFIVEFPRRLIHDKLKNKLKLIELIGRPEFDLPKAVLDLVYSQTLCWMAVFFSPLIAVISLVKCFILFYVKKLTLLKNYNPPTRPYRTSRSYSLFVLVLLISFILSVIPVSYMVGNFQPSQSCGPFRVYSYHKQKPINCQFRKNSTDDFVFFTTIINFIESGIEPWPDWIQCILFFIGTSGFLIPAIGFLIFVIYYHWTVSVGLQKTEDMLKEQIRLEGRDKKFIWSRINDNLQ